MTRQLLLPVLVALVAICWITFRDQPIRFSPLDSKFPDRYGEWAIVAGASEGLGAAWADVLCELKMNVLLVARREPEMTKLAKTLEAKYKDCSVDTWVQDLSDANLDDMLSSVLNNQDRKYGFIVYNAAFSLSGSFLEKPLKKQQLVVDVNVRGVLTFTHLFANYLKSSQRTGGMILMSSLSGEFGTAYVSNYAGTKAWNTAFAHGLRHELAPFGIDVLSCLAGPITTPSYVKAMDADMRQPLLEQSPEQVVNECVQAIGARSSIRTGVLNKLIRFFMVRLLPLEQAIWLFNSEAEKQIAWE